jgi:hypothetical protein
MWISKKVWEDVDWIHLAQGRDRREVSVNRVMTLWILINGAEFID